MANDMLIYIYDLFVFSKGEASHIDHLRQFYDLLLQHKILLLRKKYIFFSKKIEFLRKTILKRSCEL